MGGITLVSPPMGKNDVSTNAQFLVVVCFEYGLVRVVAPGVPFTVSSPV